MQEKEPKNQNPSDVTATSNDSFIESSPMPKSHTRGPVKKDRKNIVIFVIVIILICILGLVLTLAFNKFKPKYIATKCSDTASGGILSEASNNLNSEAALKPIVDKITALTDYQKDPNCLFIMSAYYINKNDYTNAQKYLNQLDSSKAETLVSTQLTANGNTIESLKKRAQFMATTATEAKNNILITGGKIK
jgi:hypothetical protein